MVFKNEPQALAVVSQFENGNVIQAAMIDKIRRDQLAPSTSKAPNLSDLYDQ